MSSREVGLRGQGIIYLCSQIKGSPHRGQIYACLWFSSLSIIIHVRAANNKVAGLRGHFKEMPSSVIEMKILPQIFIFYTKGYITNLLKNIKDATS